MSLAGNGRLGLWLASYVADWLSGWLVLRVAAGWLCASKAVWLAGWLACYVAAYVAGRLCGSLLCSSVAVAGLPTGDMAG